MKKISIFIFIVCMFFAITYHPTNITNVFADEMVKEYVTLETLENFISNSGVGKNRTAFTDGEKNASNFLAEQMQSANLSYYNKSTSYKKEFSVGNRKSQNVIGVKKSSNPSAKKVILGAHYDNNYNIANDKKSAGIFDNGSGVLCLLALMKELKNDELPFDLIFVFYGANEPGLYGSKNFVNSMSALEKRNTLIVFNYDSIGAGDYTYYYSGDNGYTYDVLLKNNPYNIQSMPLVKRLNIFSNFEKLAYTHQGLLSDNTIYLKNNITCTSFFSGNLVHKGTGFVEVENQDNIANTENDSLEFIKTNRPNFTKNINNVCELSISVLKNSLFGEVLEDSGSYINLFFFNNKIIIGLMFLVGIIIIFSTKPKSLRKASTLLND